MYVYKKLAVSGLWGHCILAVHKIRFCKPIFTSAIPGISMPDSPFFNFMLNFKRSFSLVNPSATMLTAPPRFLCVELYKAQTESMLLLLVRVVVSRCLVLTSLFLIVFLSFFFFLNSVCMKWIVTSISWIRCCLLSPATYRCWRVLHACRSHREEEIQGSKACSIAFLPAGEFKCQCSENV